MKWVKRVVVTVVIIFALFYLVSRPQSAANAVKTAGSAVSGVFDSVVVFFNTLAS